jgi:cell division protein FtsW
MSAEVTAARAAGAAPGPPRKRRAPWLPALDRPLASYYLIIGSTALLLAIGLVMVLSTSSASQLYLGDSPYGVFVKQALGALVALPLMWGLSRMAPRALRALARPALIAAIGGLLLVLVPGVGTSVDGAERWITLSGSVQLQPSEFAKLALVLWGADLLARKEQLRQLTDWRALLMPLLPGAALVALLVMIGDDIGTTFMLLVILLTLLWVIGTPGRLLACVLGLILFALLMVIVVQPTRLERLLDFLNLSGGPVGKNQQAIQGRMALGSGELFGVGLGKGTLKLGWVPNASNDFIFAILGEELGMIGTMCVVFLYSVFAYAGLRVARRMTDPFMRLAAAGITAWIVVQALVNICAVLDLLPITGVPLPLISQGLSSLIVTLAAVGVLLSFARREPGAAEALAAAPGLRARIARSLRPARKAQVAGGPEPRVPAPAPAGARVFAAGRKHPARPSRPPGQPGTPAASRPASQPGPRQGFPARQSGPRRPQAPGTESNDAIRNGAGRNGAGRNGAGRNGAGRNGALSKDASGHGAAKNRAERNEA